MGVTVLCWSYAEHNELWSRKHGTIGFNAQLVSLLDGEPIYISDPLPGKGRIRSRSTRRLFLRSSVTLAAESVKKATGEPPSSPQVKTKRRYRRPYSTYRDAYDAARGLFQ
jgi:hypothetical protein